MQAFQARLDDRPLRAIDHDGDARDAVIDGEIEEVRHGFLAVDQSFVHVHIKDVGAAIDLLARHFEGLGEIAFLDEPGEAARAGDVGALTDHDEVGVRAQHQRLGAAVTRPTRHRRPDARRHVAHGLADGRDVGGGRTAATADHVQPPGPCELAQRLRHVLRRVVEAAHGVW